MKAEKIGSFVDEEVVEKKNTNKNGKNEKIVFVKETDKEQIFKFVDSKEVSGNESTINEESMKICFK